MDNHGVQTNGVILVVFYQNLVLNLHTTTTTQCVLECLYKDNQERPVFLLNKFKEGFSMGGDTTLLIKQTTHFH